MRISLLWGPSLGGRVSFFDTQLTALRQGQPLRLFSDEWRTALALSTAAAALLALAQSDFAGVLHLGGPERMNRLEMGQRLAACLGCNASCIVPTVRAAVSAPEPRPRDLSLDSSRWRALAPRCPWPGIEDALKGMQSLVLG